MNRKRKTNSLAKARRGPPRACKPIMTSKKKNTKSRLQKKKGVTFQLSSSSIRDHDEINNHSSQEVLRPSTSNVQDVGEAESKSLLHRPQSRTTDFRQSGISSDFGASQSRHRSTADNGTHRMPVLRPILTSKRGNTKSRLQRKKSVTFNLSSSSIRDHDEINNHSSQEVLRPGTSNVHAVGEAESRSLQRRPQSPTSGLRRSTDFYNTHMRPFSYNQMPRFGYCPRPVHMTIGYNNIPFPMTGYSPPLPLSVGAPARLFEMNQLSANHFFHTPRIFPTLLPRTMYTRASDIFMNDDPRSTLFRSLPTMVTQTYPSLSNQASSTSTYMAYSRYQ